MFKGALLFAVMAASASVASAQNKVEDVNVAASQQQAADLDAKYATSLLKAGVEAPEIALKTIDGKQFSLKSLRGKYVVLDFWASWCPDCRKDIPAVKELYAKYGAKVEFIGVSFDTEHERWMKCVTDNGMKWKQVSELKKMRDAEIAKSYGVQWIPSMTLIGPDGKVVLSTVVIERMEKALSEIKQERTNN